MKFVGEFRWFCVQSQKNEWFTRVKSMKLVRDFRWLFLPAPGWTRSKLLRKVTSTLAEEAKRTTPIVLGQTLQSVKVWPRQGGRVACDGSSGRSTIPIEEHELSGKRFLCNCRAAEKCHVDNLRALFRAQHPQAFDPSSSARPPLSSELNLLAKAREDREDSEESGLEGAEADAPQGWPGTGK